MEKAIWFDMDGTIADLYGYDEWLLNLKAERTSPYRDAKPMLNMSAFARTIHKLQDKGFKVGVISWTAKGGSAKYNFRVKCSKIKWLKKHLPSVTFDEINIVEYGTDKTSFGSGILFDDEESNRLEWELKGGIAFDEKDIIKQLNIF